MDDEGPVLVEEREGGVLVVTLNRPHVKNAVDAAAVEGWAVAGGLELVLACDLVVAAQEAADRTFAESWERQDELTGPVFTSHDAREGAAAFAEKQAPRWTGR